MRKSDIWPDLAHNMVCVIISYMTYSCYTYNFRNMHFIFKPQKKERTQGSRTNAAEKVRKHWFFYLFFLKQVLSKKKQREDINEHSSSFWRENDMFHETSGLK